jgi:hypothetical protein
MDKRHKTRWEKNMLQLQIALLVIVPLLFGLAFFLIARHHANSH